MVRVLFVAATFGFLFLWLWSAVDSFFESLALMVGFYCVLFMAAIMQRDSRRQKVIEEIASEDD